MVLEVQTRKHLHEHGEKSLKVFAGVSELSFDAAGRGG